MSTPRFAVILPAAGKSSRFGARDKLSAMLAGRTVLQHSVLAFLHREDVVQVIIATSDFDSARAALSKPPCDEVILENPKVSLCAGGAQRADTVLAALASVLDCVDWIAVHDAARPLASMDLIDRTFAAALLHGAAVPALPVHLTVKQAIGPLPARVIRTLPRHELWAMQTPQVMRKVDLQDAFGGNRLPAEQVTDDVQLIELAGKEVWLVPGEERNLKITTSADLQIAELFAAQGLSPMP